MSRVRQSEAIGRRIKAAIVLAGREAQEVKPLLARQLNMSPRTFDRLLSGQRRLEDEELALIAEALDVPEWFLREGLSKTVERAATDAAASSNGQALAPDPQVVLDAVAALTARVSDGFDSVGQRLARVELRLASEEPPAEAAETQ